MIWALIAVCVALLISWILGIRILWGVLRKLAGLIYYMEDHDLSCPKPEELEEILKNVKFERVKKCD